MKAKKSLMAVLWPLLKQKIQEGLRYITAFMRLRKDSPDKRGLNLKVLEQEIIEFDKKLENSRQKAERYKQESTIPRILPDAGNVIKYHDRNNDKGEGSEVQMSWREEEDEDRSYVQECFDRLSMTAGVVWSLLIGKRLSHRSPALASPAPHNDGVMGMRWILVLVLIMGIYSSKVKAQSPAGLQVGEQMPDITISNLINYKTSTAKISDFKGKLLILDFWGSYCGACISGMPKLDSLQKQFEGKLQILIVTEEKEKRLQQFLQSRPLLKALKQPFVYEDTVLTKLFPHNLFPHVAWINSDGKVELITDASEVNAANIQKILSGKKTDLAVKKDQLYYNKAIPLLINDNGGESNDFTYRSLITGYKNGLQVRTGLVKEQERHRLFANNQHLIDLYKIALRFPSWYNDKRVVISPDLSAYVPPAGATWNSWKNTYSWCYDLVLPENQAEMLYSFMQTDLNRYFGINGRMEKQVRKGYALVVTDAAKLPVHTQGSKPGNNLYAKDKSVKYFSNYPLSFLVSFLNNQPGLPLVLDETGYTRKADMLLVSDMANLPALKKTLKTYGLDLIEKEMEVDIMVLSASDLKNQPLKQ